MLVLFSPFFSNLFTTILAFGPSDFGPFVTAVTASIIVTNAIVHAQKRDVSWDVTFVLAIEARESEGSVGVFKWGIPQRWGGQRREVGACCGAGFIRPVRAIAKIIIDLGRSQLQ